MANPINARPPVADATEARPVVVGVPLPGAHATETRESYLAAAQAGGTTAYRVMEACSFVYNGVVLSLRQMQWVLLTPAEKAAYTAAGASLMAVV